MLKNTSSGQLWIILQYSLMAKGVPINPPNLEDDPPTLCIPSGQSGYGDRQSGQIGFFLHQHLVSLQTLMFFFGNSL